MSTRWLTARNPRTGLGDYRFEAFDVPEIAAAAQRARAAQIPWQRAGLGGRHAALSALHQQLQCQRESLRAALEQDTGRGRLAGLEIDAVLSALSLWPKRAEVLAGSEWRSGQAQAHLRYACEWRPYPVVGAISPWNFPLLLAFIDAVPALCAGCAVLIKPSEVTPRFLKPLQAALDAVPALHGVLTLVPGDGLSGAALLANVDCVCFTGSVATGRQVAVQAAARLIPAYLELGGKDPLIVLHGADLAAAVTAALRGSVLATGQACQSIERIYVQRPLYQSFVERLVEAARNVRLNFPDIHQGEVGPIIHAPQAQIIERQLADARARGACILTGGRIEHHGGGLWIEPTVVTQVSHEMQLLREETFGPVLPVMPFDEVEEAIALANFGEFGLSAAVFAGTLEEAARVARELEAGAVSLNDAALTALFYEAPKQSFRNSGLGPSRMGPDGVLRFARRQALIANTGSPLPLAAFSETAAH